MDIVEQLWLLKQIYKNENSYYDREEGASLYHIPGSISQDMLKELDKAHHTPNRLFTPEHDGLLMELSRQAPVSGDAVPSACTLCRFCRYLQGLWFSRQNSGHDKILVLSNG